MKTKLKIIIPIIIAVAAIISAIIFIQFKPNETQFSDKPFDLAQNYLIEHSYEQAIAEFKKAIEIDPMNVDAYIGIAEAYEAIGNRDMAVEWLEKGLEATGDERLRVKLEELLSGDAEAVEVVTTTEVTTTVAETTTMETTTTPAPVEEFITIGGEKYSTLLTELDLSNRFLTNEDIKDLDKMINLTTLDLGYNEISDISPLSGLTNLTKLYLGGNQISDISQYISLLSGLDNLTELDLSFNEISDISPLSKLTNLTKLDLGWNEISDISPLSGLTNLTVLNLQHNKISDISSLSGLTNLRWMCFHSNQISDISPLSGLTNLTELLMADNQISDISPLSGLTNLTYLYLDGNDNHISDSDIEELKRALPECDIYN